MSDKTFKLLGLDDPSVSIECRNLDLIRFMFSNFDIVDEVPIFPSKPIILRKDLNGTNLPQLSGLEVPHILLVNAAGSVNLNDRKTLVTLAYKKHNKRIPAYIEQFLDPKIMNNEEFFREWKILWTSGNWGIKEVESLKKYYEFIEKFTFFNALELDKYFFRALESSSIETMESRVLNLMSLAQEYRETQQISTKSEILKKVAKSIAMSHYTHIKDAALFNIHSEVENDVLRFYNFFHVIKDTL